MVDMAPTASIPTSSAARKRAAPRTCRRNNLSWHANEAKPEEGSATGATAGPQMFRFEGAQRALPAFVVSVTALDARLFDYCWHGLFLRLLWRSAVVFEGVVFEGVVAVVLGPGDDVLVAGISAHGLHNLQHLLKPEGLGAGVEGVHHVLR